MLGIEFVHINDKCDLTEFRKELRWNEVFYRLDGGLS
jgi:L-arabinose isomerase